VSSQLSDTRVFFDGIASPLVYEVAGQLSAVVPYGVANRSSTSLVLQFNGAASSPVSIPVAASSPALFTLSASGVGQVAALNQDGSVNGPGKPATKGSVVVLYGTGMGVLNPASLDGAVTAGLANSTLPVQVQIGGKTATFLYAGGAPSLISGAFQINATIPADAPGGTVPVLVTVGSVTSPAGVTLTVQ
jgi:uncharacterized protein (TIGR03437 family)